MQIVLRSLFPALIALVFLSASALSLPGCTPQPLSRRGSAIERQSSAAPRVALTLIHTNDIHSHFKPERNALNLGGIARIKTLVDRIRDEQPNSILIDGGDWSEGSIYYLGGAGRETLRIMEAMGYEVAAMGNHDFLNGPKVLTEAVRDAQTRIRLLAANLSFDKYGDAAEFRKHILPYTIKTIAGVRVAFIGVTTYELIYDHFIRPVQILEPMKITRELSEQLRKQADVIIAISHNNVAINKQLLKAAPEVDLVIGAHDHKKLTEPEVVERNGYRAGWLVEAGSWGRYLGRVDLSFVPGQGVSLDRYALTQVDSSIPEDPGITARVEDLERSLEAKLGPIFHDSVGHADTDIERGGLESPMLNLATDSYRDAVASDFSMDTTKFVYGGLFAGNLTTADIFNGIPGVYNLRTGRSWTVKMLPMTGRTLKWFLSMVYSSSAVSTMLELGFSNLSLVFNPLVPSNLVAGRSPLASIFPDGLGGLAAEANETALRMTAGPVLQDIRIDDEPLDLSRKYRIAVSDGMIQAIEFINSIFPMAIPLTGVVETGTERWRMVVNRVRRLSPISADTLPITGRVRTLQSDLGLTTEAVQWRPIQQGRNEMLASITVRVRNFGAQRSGSGSSLYFMTNLNGTNYSVAPRLEPIAAPLILPPLNPGEQTELRVETLIPKRGQFYPLTLGIAGNTGELNTLNDQVVKFFTYPESSGSRSD